MAYITRYPLVSHLRAEPNQHILHYSSGKLARQGIGLAYWFNPLSAAVAQVPAEDCTATFVLNERTADFQQVAVQCTVVYRFKNPESAVGRLNFTVSLQNGLWTENPLEKVTTLWSQSARTLIRTYLAGVAVGDAVRGGPAALGPQLRGALAGDPAMQEIGIALVSVQIDHIAPTPDVQKALETPTRESIQQKADAAAFERRALAEESERAIKQNELQTQVDLAQRQDELIRLQGANRLREVESTATAERARLEAEINRQALVAEAKSRDQRTLAEGDAVAKRTVAESESFAKRTAAETDAFAKRTAADAAATSIRLTGEAEAASVRARASAADAESNATRLNGEAEALALKARIDAEADAEVRKLQAWSALPPGVAMALGVKAMGEKIQNVGDINLTPDMLSQLVQWVGSVVKPRLAETGTPATIAPAKE